MMMTVMIPMAMMASRISVCNPRTKFGCIPRETWEKNDGKIRIRILPDDDDYDDDGTDNICMSKTTQSVDPKQIATNTKAPSRSPLSSHGSDLSIRE